MCSHYQGIKERERYIRRFGINPPDDLCKYDVWLGYAATAIHRPKHWGVGDDADPPREAFTGRFGLIPHWATDLKVSRNTFNARSETVAVKPSFRDAWKRSQRCIIPMDAFYEPDWRTGKAIATRITSVDGEPMGVAGLWSWWKPPAGDVIHSFTMLTINADGHSLMEHFHKPTDEKRMVVILPPDRYQDWLESPLEHGMDFMRQYPSELLSVTPTPSGEGP